MYENRKDGSFNCTTLSVVKQSVKSIVTTPLGTKLSTKRVKSCEIETHAANAEFIMSRSEKGKEKSMHHTPY